MAEKGKEKKRGPEWNVRLSREPGRLRRETAFLCNIRFKNDLPEIPCDPKLLLPPYNREEVAAFKLTELEKDLKKELLFEADLGIPIHAWNIEQYSAPDGPPQELHPNDAALLQSDEEQDPKRARLRGEAAEVSWLMRTKYIAAEAGLKRGVGARPKRAAAAAAAGEGEGEEEEEDPKAARVRQIEAQFAAAKAPPVHCKDPSLRPLEVLPVFPDALMDGRSCVLASFDNDPLQDVPHLERLPAEQRARMTQAAQLKSFKPQQGKQFAALLVPDAPPAPGEDELGASGGVAGAALALDYRWVREYNANARLDDTRTSYLFRFAGDGTVRFHDLNTRLDLRKRRAEEGEETFVQPEKVIVRLPGQWEEEQRRQAEAEEERRRQEGGGARSGDQPRRRHPLEDSADDEEQQGGGAAGGGGGGGDVEMEDAEGSEEGGRREANAALRAAFGSDDDDI